MNTIETTANPTTTITRLWHLPLDTPLNLVEMAKKILRPYGDKMLREASKPMDDTDRRIAREIEEDENV
jgi:hypothetical protein